MSFSEDSNNDNVQPVLSLDKDKKISHVTKCLHLEKSISTKYTQRSLINNALADLNIKSNNLLADFSFSNSSTLSVLFKSYRMNIYGSTLWRYINHSNVDNFCVSWRKIVRRLWKTPIKTHNSLVHLINKFDSCILKKRCVKFLWRLFNSDNALFSRIIRYSMHNSDITIGENVRYFMYKYKIVYNDWFIDVSHIFNRIDNQIQLITKLDDICVAGAIRELCEARDSGVVQFIYRNQICKMIDMLCTR